jgi:hypothetical protein
MARLALEPLLATALGLIGDEARVVAESGAAELGAQFVDSAPVTGCRATEDKRGFRAALGGPKAQVTTLFTFLHQPALRAGLTGNLLEVFHISSSYAL